jgi:hypothetical protein
MNRSILIVICDFLLVSLLAFSTVDISTTGQATTAPVINTDLAMKAPAKETSAHQDLGDVMRLALLDERRNRDVLLAELNSTRSAYNSQQETLSNRSQQIQAFQEQLQSSQEQNRRFEEQEAALRDQLASAETNVQNLNQQLRANSVQTILSQEEREVREAESQKEQQRIATLQAQLADLQSSNQAVVAERERLAGELQSAEIERQATVAQLTQAQDEVAAQRNENARLAQGVQTLASNSTALTEEIREEHPLPANAIFDNVVANRATVNFVADRSGFFGQDVAKSRATHTVLVSNGSQIFALCHVHDTPLNLWNPGTDWHELSAELTHDSTSAPASMMVFSLLDPRIVLLPISSAEAHKLGCKIYRISTNDFQFQDTVVIGTEDNYYGECKFEIDLTTPLYFKMDHHSLNPLFGKFNPSSGDLVFTKSGDFLGIMANNTYCARIRNEDASAVIDLGPESRNQGISETLADLYSVTTDLPSKLQ